MSTLTLSPLASLVVSVFEKKEAPNHERRISVNPVVSKVAAWYEKLRNSMEYREDEVILRASIERVLKRRLLLGGNAKTTAEPLVRELVWAGYLTEQEVPESLINRVEESIDLFLQLRRHVLSQRVIPETQLNEWTYHLMSSDIEDILSPSVAKKTVANFMFQLLKDHITITDDTKETTYAQVFMAVRRAFAGDDLALLRYHLFMQYFGKVSKENIEYIFEHFKEGFDEVTKQLTYRRKDRIYGYIKRKTAAFFILEDLLRTYKGEVRTLVQSEEEFKKAVFALCRKRYEGISAKIQRAIVRSVLFILLTKVIFAFAVEATYERIAFGNILWTSMAINIGIPPLLMIIVSFFIRTPGEDNSKRVFGYMQQVLLEEHPRLGSQLEVQKKPSKKRPLLNTIFTVLWFLAFLISFGAIIYVLTRLQFNIVSQAVFIFFIAIVSFLAYRINLTAKTYTLGDKQGLLTPIIDFFFMPIVRVGRHLTEGIAQINILLFVFDFIIETPFKTLFAFFEDLFSFLHSKREELG